VFCRTTGKDHLDHPCVDGIANLYAAVPSDGILLNSASTFLIPELPESEVVPLTVMKFVNIV
jgi:hypothetical protein